MIAYVRGQCLVPPPVLDADGNERPDPLGGHACLVAADATLRGEGLRELVPCREIVESIGSAASLTTLVAIDLGNLRWDPRIGVLCSLVPRQLDRDFKAPPVRANGQNWVIASHDSLQYSGASDTAKRTFFAAALEQGLAGAADEPPWGDGDRVVELHELAQFVVAWTSEWSRLATGGRDCARSYGVDPILLDGQPEEIVEHNLANAIPRSHLAFLASLPDTARFGDYLLVHAGIRPGVDLAAQRPADLRWIRKGFLEADDDHGFLVVHGHSVALEIEKRANRVGIDTGAYRTGILTAMWIEDEEHGFLQAVGAPDEHRN
jgi:hypothetical protein